MRLVIYQLYIRKSERKNIKSGAEDSGPTTHPPTWGRPQGGNASATTGTIRLGGATKGVKPLIPEGLFFVGPSPNLGGHLLSWPRRSSMREAESDTVGAESVCFVKGIVVVRLATR